MRRLAALSALLFAAALPLSAQFEGTITMTMNTSGNDKTAGTMKWYVQGSRMAMEMSVQGNSSAAGEQMRMVVDPVTHTTTMLVPLSDQMKTQMGSMAASIKGFKMVMHSDSMGISRNELDVTLTKLGTSETIAGMKCDDYQMTPKSGKPVKACISDQFGEFVYPQSAAMGPIRGAPPPAWTKAFGNKPAFPLKVWTDDGKVAMQVTSVERGPVPASMFEIPADYMDMKGMMGMMGRGGGH